MFKILKQVLIATYFISRHCIQKYDLGSFLHFAPYFNSAYNMLCWPSLTSTSSWL